MTRKDTLTSGEGDSSARPGPATPSPTDPERSGDGGILRTEDGGLRYKRAIINFLAIFLGVSLSFLAEDWREDLNELEEGERVLEGILADIQQDVPAALNIARSDSVATDAGLWLHRNWERTELPSDSVDWALAALHGGGPYTPLNSEYESAKYAGRLQYIEDTELRQQITSLYEGTQPFLVRLYDLRADFTLEFWRLLRPYERFAEEFGGGGVVPAVHLAVPWSEVSANGELRNALVQSISFRRIFSLQLRQQARESEELRDAIREATE